MNPLAGGYFLALREDLEAARQLRAGVPRSAAFHLQQAAEKLVKAILTMEGIHAGAEHSIGLLAGKLPAGHEWKADLMALDRLSQYATTFRYPRPGGQLPAAPPAAELERDLTLVAALADEAEEWGRQTARPMN